MKRLIFGLGIAVFAMACQENENISVETTGNEMVYPLQQASDYAVSGTVTFREKCDGATLVEVSLTGTEGDIEHPVHLHLGDLSAPGAEVAALLNPVLGNTGKSATTLRQLADESIVSYRQLVDLKACIKVHLSASGPEREIILAGGNVGSAINSDVSGGRSGIGICKSE